MEAYQMTDEARPAFVVDNDNNADWAIRKIAEARAIRDRRVAHYMRQVELAKQECEREEQNMTALLAPWFDSVPKHETKTQTKYELPSGTVIVKHPQPKFTPDNDKLVYWMKMNGYVNLVKAVTTEQAQWGELKKETVVVGNMVTLKETGEVVEGVTVEHRPDVMEIKVRE